MDSPASRARPAKRAERIAAAIEADIFRGEWSAGHRLGNEADLAEAHGVSRWTMREAVAILEQAGTVTMRRGGGGGLFVAAPAAAVARHAIAAFLELSNTPIDSILAIRRALARIAIEAAIAKLSSAERAALAALLLREDVSGVGAVMAMGEARDIIREGADNPALTLLLGALADIVLYSAWRSALDDTAFTVGIDRLTAHSRTLVLAILANDAAAAIAAETASLGVMRELHAASNLSGTERSAPNAAERAYALYPVSRPKKKAEAVARAIRQQIADDGLLPGHNLGTEVDLRRQHAVGRPVLREAVRILERIGIAAMGRGGASGLTVALPRPARVVELARTYLGQRACREDHRAAARSALAPLAQDAATKLMLDIVAD